MNEKVNPYASPQQADDQVGQQRAANSKKNRSLLGFVLSLAMCLPYFFVLVVSLYEYSQSSDRYANVDYVRHALASGFFLAVCSVAARGFWKGYRSARTQLMVGPLLLIVFYYPGLNAVWNFGAQLLGS